MLYISEIRNERLRTFIDLRSINRILKIEY